MRSLFNVTALAALHTLPIAYAAAEPSKLFNPAKSRTSIADKPHKHERAIARRLKQEIRDLANQLDRAGSLNRHFQRVHEVGVERVSRRGRAMPL